MPVSTEIAIASRVIPLPHKDPADRFIAATAKLNGLTLVTSDRSLLACPDLDLLPA
ncbi:MAG: PIN domain-containing protein [Gammaproteobacteria bacterium]|nr:PIN domain-containing protein [Gammaproteobacteria bacterium]MCY4181879.1 PIN domain-containing protein [Gammaproteobacteria bacterium]MCY4270202.1 PIN domain-containing protein [Gammaproteobacteria bacterium]